MSKLIATVTPSVSFFSLFSPSNPKASLFGDSLRLTDSPIPTSSWFMRSLLDPSLSTTLWFDFSFFCFRVSDLLIFRRNSVQVCCKVLVFIRGRSLGFDFLGGFCFHLSFWLYFLDLICFFGFSRGIFCSLVQSVKDLIFIIIWDFFFSERIIIAC